MIVNNEREPGILLHIIKVNESQQATNIIIVLICMQKTPILSILPP